MTTLYEPAPPTARRRGAERQFGDGPLGRAAATAYRYLAVDVFLLLALAPSIAVGLALEPVASNVPLYALALVPVGPALSAGMGALARLRHDGDLAPWPAFRRAYAAGLRDSLAVWAPWAALVAVIGMPLAHREALGLSAGYAIVLLAIAALATVIALHALTLGTFFAFRWRDRVRLGAFLLGAKPLASLAVASLLVLVGAAAWAGGVPLVAGLAVLWCALLLSYERPPLRDVARRFVTPSHPENEGPR